MGIVVSFISLFYKVSNFKCALCLQWKYRIVEYSTVEVGKMNVCVSRSVSAFKDIPYIKTLFEYMVLPTAKMEHWIT